MDGGRVSNSSCRPDPFQSHRTQVTQLTKNTGKLPIMNAFLHTTELSSIAIGARVLAVSDDFFASVDNLILVEPAISLKGQFGPNGALYSGWESRRHNTAHDWCIIRLGTSGSLIGFDIDTSHFNGNEAPAVSVDAFLGPPDIQPAHDDPRVSNFQFCRVRHAHNLSVDRTAGKNGLRA